jgi:hypothetical protein
MLRQHLEPRIGQLEPRHIVIRIVCLFSHATAAISVAGGILRAYSAE